MMPLPTYTFPRHETESRMPAETRRALRWEGVSGPLPRAPARPWLERLRGFWRAPVPAPAPAPERAAPPKAPAHALLQAVPPILKADDARWPAAPASPLLAPAPRAPPAPGVAASQLPPPGVALGDPLVPPRP